MIKLRLSCCNNLRAKNINRDKEDNFIIIKGSIHQEDIRNSKCLCTYNRELKYMKQRTQNYKEKFTII